MRYFHKYVPLWKMTDRWLTFITWARHLGYRLIFPQQRFPLPLRYVSALVAMSLMSIGIGVIKTHVGGGLLALLYVLVTLWLATTQGRGPAVFGSVIAVLEYDFFFVPPLHELVVSGPPEIISLIVLLITSLVVGQLIVIVRERQQQATVLMELARAIAEASDRHTLLQTLVDQILRVFQEDGLRACQIITADGLDEASAGLGGPGDIGQYSAVFQGDDEHLAEGEALVTLPLQRGGHLLGGLTILGSWQNVQWLAGQDARFANQHQELLMSFRDQSALALERLALKEEAIHVEAQRASNIMKSTLLQLVTHDLRSPLTAIQASITSLRDQHIHWTEQEQRVFFDSINSGTERLSRLVRNFLDLSGLESGVAQPELRWYPIEDVILGVLDRLEMTHQTLSHQLAWDMPDAPPILRIDPIQIEQVLTNLLENAFKYSPPGSLVRIQAAIAQDGRCDMLEVRITDMGVGIPAEALPHIFEPFYRVPQRLPWEQDEHRVSGTGLGLAICQAIVRAHGGDIWATSVVGEGTTFWFTLPIPSEPLKGALPELPLEILNDA